jgi:hypothetical protein
MPSRKKVQHYGESRAIKSAQSTVDHQVACILLDAGIHPDDMEENHVAWALIKQRLEQTVPDWLDESEQGDTIIRELCWRIREIRESVKPLVDMEGRLFPVTLSYISILDLLVPVRTRRGRPPKKGGIADASSSEQTHLSDYGFNASERALLDKAKTLIPTRTGKGKDKSAYNHWIALLQMRDDFKAAYNKNREGAEIREELEEFIQKRAWIYEDTLGGKVNEIEDRVEAQERRFGWLIDAVPHRGHSISEAYESEKNCRAAKARAKGA